MVDSDAGTTIDNEGDFGFPEDLELVPKNANETTFDVGAEGQFGFGENVFEKRALKINCYKHAVHRQKTFNRIL